MIPSLRHGPRRLWQRWCVLDRHRFCNDADVTEHVRVTQEEIARYAAGISNLTMFKRPGSEPFEKQRISGLNSRRMDQVGLKRFEPCPAGYTFVDADVGGGAFARVFLVRNEATQDLQAMKRVDRVKLSKHFQISDAEAEQMVEQEFWQMQRTNHPHIIKLFDFFQDERYAYFIMESVNGGTLRQLLTTLHSDKGSRISEGYVAELLHQALYALRHLHFESRIHKDVKLENLMLLAPSGPPHLVLIDLGVAETLQPQQGEAGPMPAGTPQTMAPEVIDCMLGKRASFDDKCDVFSLGIVAHQLFTGEVPYKVAYTGGKSYGPVDYEKTRANMEEAELTGQLKVSEGALDFIKRMLQLDPEKRPSSLECLEHPWLVNCCERRRIRRLRAEGRTSLGGASLSIEADQAAGEELLWMERRRVCKALVRFAKRTPLQRAVAYHLAAYLPVGDLRRAADSFKRVDQAKSGHISYDEIAKALEDVLGIDRENGLLVAAAMDTDHTSRLDFQEFSAALAMVSGDREQRLFDKLLAKLQISPEQDLTFEEVHAAVEQAMKQEVTREELVHWLGKVAKRQQKELYDNPAGIVSNADFRKLFGQRSLRSAQSR
ncbi:unnamed protein product [Durusdinium trenchii]|uniref:Uncharacterized protein n=2 Tax=Durusdinium trenchii TaxID=1381693 RepID=A0ABP0PNN4_9DINO